MAMACDLVYASRQRSICRQQAVFDAARRTLQEIAANSPAAVALSKSAVNATYGRPTPEALDIETAAFRRAFTGEDMREGTRAFIGKRPAALPGR